MGTADGIRAWHRPADPTVKPHPAFTLTTLGGGEWGGIPRRTDQEFPTTPSPECR